jgi:hypothetical protein
VGFFERAGLGVLVHHLDEQQRHQLGNVVRVVDGVMVISGVWKQVEGVAYPVG